MILKLINKETINLSRVLDVTRKQLQHWMVIIIEVLRQNISKYIDCEESKNAQESKLLSVLNNALMIAKWMDKISSDSQNDENDFQIPKDLQMFEAIKTKIFDAMSSKNNIK